MAFQSAGAGIERHDVHPPPVHETGVLVGDQGFCHVRIGASFDGLGRPSPIVGSDMEIKRFQRPVSSDHPHKVPQSRQQMRSITSMWLVRLGRS